MVQQEEIPIEMSGEESPPIEFPTGLIGLEEWKKFSIISQPAGGNLRLLQSLDDSRISFIVGSPFDLMPDYKLVLSQAEADVLGYSGGAGLVPFTASELAVYCILSIQEDPLFVTANMLGPLIINWKTGVGLQVIQTDNNYSSRYVVVDQSGVLEADTVALKEA
jgi:flagellar assembly factor FliW